MRGSEYLWRVALAAALGAGVAAGVTPGVGVRSAYASDDDEDEDDDEDDEDEDEDDDEDEDEEAQPPVTAGGLYTLRTFPTRELSRPLTLSQGISEARVGLGVDVSAQTAFESVGVLAGLHYGLRDHVELQFEFDSAYNFDAFAIEGAIEAALSYDLVDFRSAFRVSRPGSPAGAGDVTAGIDVGFPFRYVAKPEIAIIALDTLMSIDFDSKPDLTPSVGVVTNPIDAVSLKVEAQLQIIDFNTEADGFLIPVSATLQLNLTNKLDLGAVFTFPNLKPPEPAKFYDQRFLTIFGQARF
ncbi:MAG: hypothetical protein R2939_01800 [Kofleriaceae bacterium]